jgi:hypothetical protein
MFPTLYAPAREYIHEMTASGGMCVGRKGCPLKHILHRRLDRLLMDPVHSFELQEGARIRENHSQF